MVEQFWVTYRTLPSVPVPIPELSEPHAAPWFRAMRSGGAAVQVPCGSCSPSRSNVRSQPVWLLKRTPVLRAAVEGGGTQGSLLSVTPNPAHGGWTAGELNSTGQWSDSRLAIRDTRIPPAGGLLDTA
ncbi:hypothetical protein ACWCQL_24625 [Streptomyces sp. NPDC002073]